MQVESEILISKTDVETGLTRALSQNFGSGAKAHVSLSGDHIVVRMTGVKKEFKIGPLSKEVEIAGDVDLRTTPSELQNTVALAWKITNFPALLTDPVNWFVHAHLVELPAIKNAVRPDASRVGLLVIDPAHIEISGTRLGEFFRVTALEIPGRNGAAISVRGSMSG